MRYGVRRIDPAHLPAAPCPIFWLGLSGEIQQRFRRMTTRADLIATIRRRPGSSKGSARRGSAAAFQLAPPESKLHRRRFKTFDTSGKSPAYLHHRKNSKARAGKPAAGFFNPNFLNRTAAARHGATSSHAPLPEASQAGRRPSLFLNSAGTRERAGTRRGQVHGRTRPPLDGDKVRARNDRMKRSCRTFISYRAGGRHDRISDRARPGGPRRHCSVGGVPVSAEIIQFMPRPKHNRVPTGFRRLVFRSTARPDDLVVIMPTCRLANMSGQAPKESGLNMAKAVTEIRSLARSHTRTALNVLVGVMRSKDATAAARVAAANAILDRGWGKAPQAVENGESGALELIHKMNCARTFNICGAGARASSRRRATLSRP